MRPTTTSASRRGSALLIVLILAILLLVTTLSLWTANEAQESQNDVNITRVQAEYLVTGAHQLALLKAKLLAQALYDASDYAVGKNPFYPHSQGYDDVLLNNTRGGFPNLSDAGASAPGPAFLTGSPDRPDTEGDIRAISIGGTTPQDDAVRELYLNRFRADLTDATAGGGNPPAPQPPVGWGAGLQVDWQPQAQITISNAAPCPVMGAPDPYSGSFEVTGIRVLGGRDNQIHNEEAMMIGATARVQTTVRGEAATWESDRQRVYKMRRLGY